MNKKEFYKELSGATQKTIMELHEIEKERNQLIADKDSGRYTDNEVKLNMLPKIDQLRKDMEKKWIEGKTNVASVVKKYSEILRKEDALIPEDMTEDVKLLNSGIPLTQRDLQDIIDRNPQNRTMAQLALRYADQNNIEGLSSRYYIPAESQVKELQSIQYVSETAIRHYESPSMCKDLYNRLMGAGSDVASICGVEGTSLE